jgi:hypothetical protein
MCLWEPTCYEKAILINKKLSAPRLMEAMPVLKQHLGLTKSSIVYFGSYYE